MLFNPRELYLSRKKASAETFAPYIRYVAQSGLLLVIAFAAIVFIDQYIKLVKNTPEQFPLAIVVTIVMTCFIVHSPYRTWLKPADIIYVMPKQANMLEYLNYCRKRSYLITIIPFMIVLALVTMLVDAYALTDRNLYIVPFMLLKIVVFYTLYNINELPSKGLVFAIRLVTTIAVVLGIYFTLQYDFVFSALISSMVVLICSAYVQYKTKAFFNWQQLIENEQRKIYRTYRFLNWFVDTPHAQSSTRKRQYLARFAHTIKFTRSNTFSFLHYLTFARSEVGGIYIRNLIVGSIIAYIMATTMLWNGYASLFFAVLFMAMNAVQLSTLRQIHQHSVWQNIYPIPLTKQHQQMTSIEYRLLLVAAIILTILPTLPFMIDGDWRLVGHFALAMLIILVWRIAVISSRVKKLTK